MAYIDDFIENSASKMTWWQKVVRDYPKVKSTKFISDDIQYVQLGNQAVMETSILKKVVNFLILPIPALIWIAILLRLLASPTLGFLFAFLLVTYMLYLLLSSLFSKRYNYTITIDMEGISIDKNKIYWTSIGETGIMSKREGKETISYLLIFKTDTTMEKCDLRKFVVSDRALATIIEYYKAKAKAKDTIK